jgi:ferredoxin
MDDSSPTPPTFRVTLHMPDGVQDIAVRAGQHIWDAAAVVGILLPSICHHGRCLTCAGQLLAPGDFDQSDADQYYAEDRAAGFILLCTASPLSDLRIRTHAQDEMRRHRITCGLPAPYS